jgi:hypothetical protein
MDPKPFNMHNPVDVDCWFMEMKGYLRACDFVNQGTDRSGRKYALEGFKSLREMLVSDRIQQTYPDDSGGRLNIDWGGLLRLHEAIHDRIALEGCVCETCGTKGCHRPATWEIECRGVGVSGRLIYSCDEHCPDPAILSPQDEMRRLVEE